MAGPDRARCASCRIDAEIDCAVNGSRCKSKRLSKVFLLEVRVLLEQLRAVGVGGEDFEHTPHGDPHPPNAGLTTHFPSLDRDSIEWGFEIHDDIMPYASM